MKTAVIVGAGHRALKYASLALSAPEKLRIVGVADPLPDRREAVRKLYKFPESACFESAEDLVGRGGKIADAAINGTMDCDHVVTTLPLLAAGYDVLLEKPFAVNTAEVRMLEDAVKHSGRQVMICHVLRYAPFYQEIKKRILHGDIGEIVDIQTAEHVSYHHYSAAYVRGKWSEQTQCGASVLLAKCCHDLDLIAWFKSRIDPVSVDSMGSLNYFTRRHAPPAAGNYCLLDCPLEATCDYSCGKQHLDHPDRWSFYVWPKLGYRPEYNTIEYKTTELRNPAHPYARCVWKCTNDQPDRQSVMIEFADGSLASHQLIGNTTRPMRKLHIIGTDGEIEGVFDDNRFCVRKRDLRPGCEYTEEWNDIGKSGDTTGATGGHGGGDLRLMEDFLELVEGRQTSISCTTLSDSLTGHRLVFAADRARNNDRRVAWRECL